MESAGDDSCGDRAGHGRGPCPGGGGGGAGVTGGAGGAGGMGENGNGGAGGVGGAHGFVGATFSGSAQTGGAGGTGGSGTIISGPVAGGGGGGGAGGYGTVITGTGNVGTLTNTITGGAGGTGGSGFNGGVGGDGGVGLLFSASGASATINAAVTGGARGTGGAGAGFPLPGVSGSDGRSGVGIVGGDLSLTLGATVSGAALAGGATADALRFTGGINNLTLNSGWGLTGAINVTGTLNFVQTSDVTINAQNTLFGNNNREIYGSGTLRFGTAGATVTLNGSNSYTGGTIIDSGNLAIGNMDALGSGAISLRGFEGSFRSNITGTLSNNVDITGTGGNRISAAAGTTLTLGGQITQSNGSTLLFGSPTETGTIVLNGSSGTQAGGFINIQGGTLRRGTTGGASGWIVPDAGSVRVLSGSTLDFNDGPVSATQARSLTGAGSVVMGTNAATVLGLGSGNFGGVISGAGSLRVQDVGATTNGTLILTGTNTYAGSTTIDAGHTLQLGEGESGLGGATGSIGSGAIMNNGALSIQRTNAVTLSNVISGTGSVTQAGAGTTTLTGANTYSGATTISSGTLQVGDGGATGQLGTGPITNNAALVINRSGALTIAGPISGTGSLTQAGTGTTSLSGTNSFSGLTTVAAGQLNLNGSVAGSVQVNSGATLSGNSTIGGNLTLGSGATLASGNSPGTTNVLGNYVGGGTLNVEVQFNNAGAPVNGTTHDFLNITGNVSGPATTVSLVSSAPSTTPGATTGNGIELIRVGGATQATDFTMTQYLLGNYFYNLVHRPNYTGTTDGFFLQSTLANPGCEVDANDNACFIDSTTNQATAINALAGNDTLQLTGATNFNFDVSRIGTTFTNFEVFQKAGASTVTLTGTAGSSGLGVDVQAGTLIAGTGQLGSNGAVNVLTPGTLQVASALTVGSIAGTGNISLGAGLTAGGNNASTTFSGAMSGTGGFVKQGTGVTILTGTNAHTGGTTVSAGTLQLGNGGATGSLGSGAVVNNGTLAFNRTGTTTLDNAISGTGGLDLRPLPTNGSVTLTGALSYTGQTNVGSRSLTINTATGTTSNLSSDILINGGALNFAGGGNLRLGNVVNTGTNLNVVTQSGSGTTTLTGNGSGIEGLQINAGTFQVGNGGTTGSLRPGIEIGNNGTLIFNRSDAYAHQGRIQGSGGLTQAGTGTMTLSGVHVYTGPTNVNAGTLLLEGSVVSNVRVAAGATLGGSGSVGNTDIDGTLSPGNSPGTLTVNGNFRMGPGAVYIAEVQGATADRVTISGAATLGGTLRLTPLGGPYTFATPYTLLSAAGGLGGTTFATISTVGTFGAGISPAFVYTNNSVLMTLEQRNLVPVLPTGTLINPKNVAGVFDAAVARGANASPFFALYNLQAASMPAALNTLSGEVHTATQAIAVHADDQFLRVLLDDSTRTLAEGEGYAFWAAPFGLSNTTDGDGSVNGSAEREVTTSNLALGIDARLGENSVLGAAVAFGQADAKLAQARGDVSADVFQIGAKASTQMDKLSLGASVNYAQMSADTARAVPVLGIASIRSSDDTEVWGGRVEAAYDIAKVVGADLSLLGALRTLKIETPALRETAPTAQGFATLAVGSQSDTSTRSELSLKMEWQPENAIGGFVQVGWAHDFDPDFVVDAAITGMPGSSFEVFGASPDENVGMVRAGANVAVSDNLTLGARLEGEFSEGVSQTNWGLNARLKF